jgi:hypothetical protein
VGLLLEELEKRGELDNTVIVFMGDNGAALFRGKGTLYEAGLNVPLIVRFPEKVKAGSVYEELISGEDIAPTLLDFASLNLGSSTESMGSGSRGLSMSSIKRSDKASLRSNEGTSSSVEGIQCQPNGVPLSLQTIGKMPESSLRSRSTVRLLTSNPSAESVSASSLAVLPGEREGSSFSISH